MDARNIFMHERKILYGGELSLNLPPPTNSGDILKFQGKCMGKYAEFSVSDEILGRHILLTGGTGTGKTNFLLHCISQLKPKMTDDDVMIIFDTKGDYFREFYNPSRDLVIGCSREYRYISRKWNIFREIMIDGFEDEEIIINTNEICRAVFAESLQKTKDIFFPNAARSLMAAVIINLIRDCANRLVHLDKFTNANLRRIVAEQDADEISDAVTEYEDMKSRAHYIAGGTEQAQGVLSEMYTVAGDLFISVFGDDGKFSVRDFVRKKGSRTLFIEYDLASGDTLSPVYSILMDLALKETLSRNSTQSRGRVYLILDELKLLPYLRHLDDGINFGRSMGLRILAGLQSIDQLSAVYRDNPAAAKNIVSGFSSVIAFRPSDTATRSYVKELHGRKIILEQYESADFKLESKRVEGNVSEDWDLIGLEKGEAVTGLSGIPPFRFKFKKYEGK